MLKRRSTAPTVVILGSSSSLNAPSLVPALASGSIASRRHSSRCSTSSLPVRMVRSFSTVKRRPPRPTRSCRNSTGPRLASFTARLLTQSGGASTANATILNATSKRRSNGFAPTTGTSAGAPSAGCTRPTVATEPGSATVSASAIASKSLAQLLRHEGADAVDIGVREVRVHGQRQLLLSGGFDDGEGSGLNVGE